MKLSFRDLKKNVFTLDAEPSTQVADIKKKVADKHSATPEQIRLIYSGKVLSDGSPIEQYSIKESDQIICMVSKPKASASTLAPSTPATSQAASTPAAPTQNTATAAQNAPATPTPAPPPAQPAERRFDDTSPLMLGPQRQAAIANMESMGFPRAEVERAMRAAFFNPDRAVEFLLNGIPENLQQEAAGPQRAAPAPTTSAGQPPAAGDTLAAANPAPSTESNEPVNLFEAAAAANQGGRGPGGQPGGGATAARGAGAGVAAAAAGGAGSLEFLRDQPMFQQLRTLVQSQPGMLEQVLQQVSASNPQLAELIARNPEQFLSLLTEGEEGEGGQLPPGAREISVTEEERDAIERLCQLGFERDAVIQAYFVCDKNEELAANYLFESPDDDEQPPS